MTSMDKAGIAIAVAVVAVAVAIASGGAALQMGDSGTSIFSPQVTQQQKQMAQEKSATNTKNNGSNYGRTKTSKDGSTIKCYSNTS